VGILALRQAGGMPRAELDVDVAVVGGGGAGLSLVVALDAQLRPGAGPAAPRIAVVDPVHRQGNDRTWCFWDAGHAGPVEPAVSRSWNRLDVVRADGAVRRLRIEPWRYAMVHSSDFYALAEASAARLGVRRVDAAVEQVQDGPRYALVRAGEQQLRARWVFDSRPQAPRRAGSTALLQHFRGWTVSGAGFEPDVATLMDFTTPQPERGVSFGYCLPLDAGRALVEYTEFSPRRLASGEYDRALRSYLQRRWPGVEPAPERVEDGAIPMTDAVFARRAGQRVFRLGTAGGATRGSTGYTFAAMQRQAAGVAAALLAGRVPLPPRPYPARHRWMDALLLRALDRGLVEGPELFCTLFARNPPLRVLRFLDGVSTPAEELALMSTAPLPAMLRAGAQDIAARLHRRVHALHR
jgi:lycopene beta-cyclase